MRRETRLDALLRPIAILVVFICICATAAAAEAQLKGVALVIGQSEYTDLAQLPNPENDARALDDLLDGLGFEVTRVLNADAEELAEELAEFAEEAASADVAVIYYSGHGIEAGGENYLIPIDADVSTPQRAGEKLVPLTNLLDRLRATVPVTIFLLDACRTNSFPPGQLVQLPGTESPVAVSPEGLGETRGGVLVAAAEAKSLGVVIGFAAEPGRAALDGEPGGNSPYAAALLKHLGATGYGFNDVMTMVSEEVYLRTAARQLPWVNSSLRRFLRFGPGVEDADPDETAIREGRRTLLLTIAAAPPATRAFVEQTATAEGVPLDALYGMLKTLGVDTTGPDIEAQLEQGAERLKAFMAERPTDAKSDPELIRLSKLADRAQAEGAIEVALKFREEASARADQLDASMDAEEARMRDNRLELAATYAEHANTAELTFDYVTAAQKYEQAFAQVELWDRDLAVQYKQWQADSLSYHGYFSGDNQALHRAIAVYQDVLGMVSYETNPQGWGAIQNNLSIALTTLGDRSADPGVLEQAAAAIRSALTVWRRDTYPVDWSVSQGNLASILYKLGLRDPDTARIEESIAVFRLALEEKSREANPRDWAQTQGNLGTALVTLGARQRDVGHLRQATEAFRQALDVLKRESYPLDWATVQNSLGNALKLMGDFTGDTARLEEAAIAFRASLEARPRERAPLDWAATQNNLGNTLVTLGEREDSLPRLEEAVAAFGLALEIYTREVSPLDWATLQNGLGNALFGIATRSDDAAGYIKAAEAYRASLEERTRERVPLDWASTQDNLGNVLREIGYREGDAAVLQQAADAYRSALTVWTRESNRYDWADAQFNLAWVLTGIGEFNKDTAALEQALAGYGLALVEYPRETAPYDWTVVQNGLSAAFQLLGYFNGDAAMLREAIVAVRNAWDGYKSVGLANDDYFAGRIADIEAAIAELEAE